MAHQGQETSETKSIFMRGSRVLEEKRRGQFRPRPIRTGVAAVTRARSDEVAHPVVRHPDRLHQAADRLARPGTAG